MPKWGRTGQRKINTATEIGGWDRFPRHPVDCVGKRRRVEPGCVYQASTADDCWLIPTDVEVETVIANPAGQNRCPEYDHRAGRLGLTLKSQHQCMAVDNS